MKCLLQNNVFELGKGNFWQFNLTFYSSEIHSSTIFLRLGFSIAAAILSLSLICLLTEKRKQQESGILWVKERNNIDTVHSYSCDLITIRLISLNENVCWVSGIFPPRAVSTQDKLFFVNLIGHFWVGPNLCFNAKLNAKLLIWKWFF